MSSEATQRDGSQDGRGGSVRWFRAFVVYAIVFVAGAAVMFYLGRHLWNFYQLQGGSEDRSLMAISAASLEGETLEVSFIRSVPDKPSGAFVLAGHKPAHNQSDPGKENTVNSDTVIFDGQEFEILFESTDAEAFPERSSRIPFTIEWVGRESGQLSLGPVDQRAINHITSYRAFLLLTKGEGEFYTSNIALK